MMTNRQDLVDHCLSCLMEWEVESFGNWMRDEHPEVDNIYDWMGMIIDDTYKDIFDGHVYVSACLANAQLIDRDILITGDYAGYIIDILEKFKNAYELQKTMGIIHSDCIKCISEDKQVALLANDEDDYYIFIRQTALPDISCRLFRGTIECLPELLRSQKTVSSDTKGKSLGKSRKTLGTLKK